MKQIAFFIKTKLKNKSYILLALILLLAFVLRFYKLTSIPPSLYEEEVALGYDAYSLLKTGKDHRGNSWPIAYINSFMDFKPPLYVYATIPSVWLFGLNEFGVRFPSAFFGTLTVLLVYLLAKKLFKETNYSLLIKNYMPELSSLLIAISPWHLQFSRAAFEVNLALFIICLGLLFFLNIKKNILFLPVSIIFFSLSLYTYHGARVFTPLFVILLAVFYYKTLWKHKAITILTILIGLVLCFPLVKQLGTKQLGQRFQETSVFATLEPIIKSNTKIAEDGGGRIAKIIHHRFLEYSKIFIKTYFTHFNLDYLFLSGDTNIRHSTQEFGILYHWEIISLLCGFIVLCKNRNKSNILVCSWFLLSIVPAALTKATPHSLRSLFGLPSFAMISALGLLYIIDKIKTNKLFIISFLFLIGLEFLLYLHFYYKHYPQLYSKYWQYGYKQAISYLNANEKKYDVLYLTNNYGRAYMYFLFYTQKDPVVTQNLTADYKNIPDIPKLGNVFIGQSPNIIGKTLWIGSPSEAGGIATPEDIYFLDGQKAFSIWETD